MSLHLAILKNESDKDHLPWVEALNESSTELTWSIIDLTRNDWLDNLHKEHYDFFLARAPGLTSLFKQLYDERIYIISKVLRYPVFPSYEEIAIYENKRMLAYFLQAKKIPHPKTNVFYYLEEALGYISNTPLPIVAKTNIGASGSGVKIISSLEEGIKYIHEAFGNQGIKQRWGPNLKTGNYLRRAFFYLKNPGEISGKLDVYRTKKSDRQIDFVIFQEYCPHKFEWRVVRIGDSFFAHKKIASQNKASGSLIKEYSNPPPSLLDFVKEITDKHQFYSQAIDLFEIKPDVYLVNEMQCFFGQSDPHQMLVENKPGRYIKMKKDWHFEAGAFNKNQSYSLRLEYVIEKLRNK